MRSRGNNEGATETEEVEDKGGRRREEGRLRDDGLSWNERGGKNERQVSKRC